MTFAGWMMVWKPNADTSEMAQIGKATQFMFRNKMHMIKTAREVLTPLNKKLQVAQSQRQGLVVSHYQQARTGLQSELSAWYGNELQGLSLSEVDLLQANQAFTLFCHAQVWQTTVSSKDVIAKNFTRMPHPNVMCTDVYRRDGLLDESTAECAPNATGKNYFACLWEQGLKKTAIFAKIRGFDAVNALATETVHEAIANSTVVQNIGPNIMRQSANVRIANQTFDFSFDNMQPLNSPTATWESVSAQLLIHLFGVARSADIANPSLRLASLALDNTEAWARIDDTRQNINYFSTKMNTSLANNPFLSPEMETLAEDFCNTQQNPRICASYETIASTLAPQLEALRQDIHGIETTLKDKKFAILAPCQDNAESLACQLEKAIQNQQNAILNSDAVAAIFLPNRLNLQLSRTDSGDFLPVVQFDKTRNSTKIDLAVKKFDPNHFVSGFVVGDEDISRAGFAPRQSSGERDTDFSSLSLSGDLNLVMQLESAVWEGISPALTGTILLNDTNTHYHGVAAFIEQQSLVIE
jgi:hypothetical protein